MIPTAYSKSFAGLDTLSPNVGGQEASPRSSRMMIPANSTPPSTKALSASPPELGGRGAKPSAEDSPAVSEIKDREANPDKQPPTVERYAQLLSHADPLADAVVEAFAELPEGAGMAMLERALDAGIDSVPESPQAIRSLFAHLDAVPDWVDLEQCTLGGATFMRCRLGCVVLACGSLPRVYSWSIASKALLMSGRLVQEAAPRLRQTARFVYAVSQPGGLGRFSEGFKMLVRVRIVHARVRRMLLKSGHWDSAAWGAPLNQCHMAGTGLLFSVGVLDGLDRLGYLFTGEEREALVRLWRYAGYLLGIEPELLCASESSGRELLALIDEIEPGPNDESRALVAALMRATCDYVHQTEPLHKMPVEVCYGVSAAIIGPRLAEALGYPHTVWSGIVPAVRPAVIAIEALRTVSPAVQGLARASGPQAFGHLLGKNGLGARAQGTGGAR